jgi:hypothetical protein
LPSPEKKGAPNQGRSRNPCNRANKTAPGRRSLSGARSKHRFCWIQEPVRAQGCSFPGSSNLTLARRSDCHRGRHFAPPRIRYFKSPLSRARIAAVRHLPGTSTENRPRQRSRIQGGEPAVKGILRQGERIGALHASAAKRCSGTLESPRVRPG